MKIEFKSGEYYTLTSFFSSNNKIVIPDLQRDYCWGITRKDKSNLVSDFVGNLIALFKDNPADKITLGLIYAYALDSERENGVTLHLCDGQQRITTLFLLLGMLNRKTKGRFQAYLMSDFERNKSGQEPYLQYAIRESTLYFLSDLVCEFFLNYDLDSLAKIKKEDWFFDEYNLDTSIESMLEALNQIEGRLTEVEGQWFEFGEFICNKLQMLYYDTGNRAQGEETYVIINRTGEPLTSTENLKPKYISQLKREEQERAGKLWEEWENFFWKNRGDNDTADKGFTEFLRWVVLLNSDKNTFEEVRKGSLFSINHLGVDTIQDYFEVVKFLFMDTTLLADEKAWLAPNEKNDQIDWFQILPLMQWVKGYGKENLRAIVRVKKFFFNLAKKSSVSKDIANALSLALRMIKELQLKNKVDIADIILLDNIPNSLVTEEELLKFTIYKNAEDREGVEDALWEAEEHPIWNGEIDPLLTWSGANTFDFMRFKSYSKVFSMLFYDSLENKELDIVRRALLTQDLAEYPQIFSGNINISFCWEPTEWNSLIQENVAKFGDFLAKLSDKREEEVYAVLEQMIEENSTHKDFDEFVKIPELLAYCDYKNIQYDGDLGWILIKRRRKGNTYANLKSYRLFLDFEVNKYETPQNWALQFYDHDGSCMVLNHNASSIAIDAMFVKEENGKDLYQLYFFQRHETYTQSQLKEIAVPNALDWTEYSPTEYRYKSALMNRASLITLIDKLTEDVKHLI